MIDVATQGTGDPASTPGWWRQLAIAALVGAVAIGTMAFLGTLFQTPGLEAPVEIAPIAVLVTVLSATAFPLVRWDNPVGYAVAALAGVVAVVGIAVYLTGTFGPTRPAPAAVLFLLLGAALVLATVAAWRERAPGPAARSP